MTIVARSGYLVRAYASSALGCIGGNNTDPLCKELSQQVHPPSLLTCEGHWDDPKCKELIKGTNLKPTRSPSQNLLPATDPDNKKAVCGKSCSSWFDLGCQFAKIQGSCGGGGGCWFGLPDIPPLGCYTIIAAVAVVAIVLFLRFRR